MLFRSVGLQFIVMLNWRLPYKKILYENGNRQEFSCFFSFILYDILNIVIQLINGLRADNFVFNGNALSFMQPYNMIYSICYSANQQINKHTHTHTLMQ